MTPPFSPKIAIACGGTGGHLFPGMAVAEQLVRRNCAVTLMVSQKDVDQQAVKQAERMEVVTLPAVGLSRGRVLAFARGFLKSYRETKRHFALNPPQAALAMGGFTSAPPVLAARHFGARTFLHESNTIPGRANRWLSRAVDHAFVGFPQAAARLHNRHVTCTGTPVRPQFIARHAGACRAALGLDPLRPVLLVMGGSQGASGINELAIRALPIIQQSAPQFQLLHLAGPSDSEKVGKACVAVRLNAVVHPFLAEMELALGAASVAISRAGASSLAELAAMQLPCVLVPYPHATDNHQFFNARAFEQTGAARLFEQAKATPEMLARIVLELLTDNASRDKMKSALARWHRPGAAQQIAEVIMSSVGSPVRAGEPLKSAGQVSAGSGIHERQEFSAA